MKIHWKWEGSVGKEDGGLAEKYPHGDRVGGFESTKKNAYDHTYIHPALADNADGEYQVRTGEKKFTIRKQQNLPWIGELLRDQEIPLIYDEDGTLMPKRRKKRSSLRVFSASNAGVYYLRRCDDPVIR